MERTTASWLGLYSLTCLFAQVLHPDGKINCYQTAWYTKAETTFSDILAHCRAL